MSRTILGRENNILTYDEKGSWGKRKSEIYVLDFSPHFLTDSVQQTKPVASQIVSIIFVMHQ